MLNEIDNIQVVWESFKYGNKEAFAHIYNRFVQELFRYGTKLSGDEELVKDGIQEIFLDLYLNREKNKTNPGNLKYYLILALRRNLIKKIKQNRKKLNESLENDFLFEPDYSIEKQIIDEENILEKNNKVLNALIKLPSKQKEAIYLRFNESLDYPEIAQLLNITVESARKQVYRAIKNIRHSFVNQSIML